MDRIQFVKAQAAVLAEVRRIVPDEAAVLQQYEQLALDTYDAFAETGRQFHAWPLWANFPDDYARPPESVPTPILARWREWRAVRQSLLQRNPRLELYGMMREIGDTDQFNSWPYYQEQAIQDWLDRGEMNPLPFSDLKGIVTPAFYARLRELRHSIGGWLYWKDIRDGVVFLPEDEWQQLRAESARTGYLDGRGGRTFKI